MKKLFFLILTVLLFWSCEEEKKEKVKFEGCYSCSGELNKFGTFWNPTDSTLYRDTIIDTIEGIEVCISKNVSNIYLLTYLNDSSNQSQIQLILYSDNSFERNDGHMIYELSGFIKSDNTLSFKHIINNTGTIITKRNLNCFKN